MIYRFIVINCSEVISSDKFILDKYNFRSSLDINITYNNIVVVISFSRVSLKVLSRLDTTLKQ